MIRTTKKMAAELKASAKLLRSAFEALRIGSPEGPEADADEYLTASQDHDDVLRRAGRERTTAHERGGER